MTQPPPPAGPPPYGAPPPPVRPRRRRTGLILVLVAAGVLLVAGAVATGLAIADRSLGAAAAGDCLHYDAARQTFERRDCGAADADSTVLGVTDSTRQCVDVVGTTRTVEANEKVLCIGEKDADPTKAVNGAKVGDCLTVRGENGERTDCVSGSRPVLAILKDQLRSMGGGADLAYKCAESEGAERVYGWTLEAVPPSPVGRYDLVFCLGPAKA